MVSADWSNSTWPYTTTCTEVWSVQLLDWDEPCGLGHVQLRKKNSHTSYTTSCTEVWSVQLLNSDKPSSLVDTLVDLLFFVVQHTELEASHLLLRNSMAVWAKLRLLLGKMKVVSVRNYKTAIVAYTLLRFMYQNTPVCMEFNMISGYCKVSSRWSAMIFFIGISYQLKDPIKCFLNKEAYM